MKLDLILVLDQIITLFKEKHGIEVKIVTINEDEKIVKRFDEKSKIFYLSEMLTYTSRNFHLASKLFRG